MPVPTLITELSTTAASNYPSGSDSPATLDDVQRAHGAFIAQIRDGVVAVAGTGLTGTASALSIGGNAATATNATNVTGTIASAATATTQTAGDNSTKVATTAYVATAIAANQGVPAGTVIHVAMSTAPTGYLKANGDLISRTTYAALFAAIGTVYGVGDGSTTFALPDLRGEFVRGWDDARGIDSGRAIGTAQAASIGPHDHYTRAGSASISDNYGGSGAAYGTNDSGLPVDISGTTATTGPGIGTETRPRNIALLACIKT